MNNIILLSDELVDIRTVSVDKNLSKEERIVEYVRQIKNPYHYRCGKFKIRASYIKNGCTLEDNLRNMIF